ncbi:MAG: hypothetical protein ACRDD8_06740 [Bacteroidales bacterium]
MGKMRNKSPYESNEDRYLKHIPYGRVRGGVYVNSINKRKARASAKRTINEQINEE